MQNIGKFKKKLKNENMSNRFTIVFYISVVFAMIICFTLFDMHWR